MDDINAHFEEQHFKDFAEQLQPHLAAGPSALSIGKYHSVSGQYFFLLQEFAFPKYRETGLLTWALFL